MNSEKRQQQDQQPESGEKRSLSRYEELCRQRSVTLGQEDLSVFTDFGEMIGAITAAQRAVEHFRKKHHGAVPERFCNLWETNLKEANGVLMKEFHALRHGRQEKKYDPRCVCRGCHAVFMVPLPAGGLCDECRAAQAPRPVAEEGPKATPPPFDPQADPHADPHAPPPAPHSQPPTPPEP